MKAPAIVDALEHLIGLDGGPIELLDSIVTVLEAGGLGELVAAETAGAVASDVRKIIDKRRDQASASGLPHTLELYGGTRAYVGGASLPQSGDSPLIATAKLGRRHVASILDAIRSLTPDQFEQFGARLVRTFGATHAAKTVQSGDQGIDFAGTVRISDFTGNAPNFFHLASDIKIDFIGQAKHYPNSRLKPAVVRELVGSLELARSRNFSTEKFTMIEGLALKSFSPVAAILITTGQVSSGARAVANSAGVILKSGEQLATYLADLGVGLEGSDFSEMRFDSWMLEVS